MTDLLVVIAFATAIVGALLVTCWKGLRSDLFVHFAREYDSCDQRPLSGDPVEE
ncbi:hypothetical protein [Mycolicibacterium holsaticum]|uniref:hypothetical protein n=1 Tax=Mycolicibacterium holsaticum TaxID=152142 RepID=UPI0013F4D12D|nr:hypothetical protein [Mycolicibacterium holsaticum]MDQ2638838.1 hypothetical protein [Actinomycetota bacterium]QZA14249.1 hypothetical protein K3U96_09155 [Mycolicibacterium holsaticum DSM 44478 = JCM 12374]UNC08298.1 hypothetical protein H5U41_17675 [Mycolicibacterium holsaticum DSM 44478 = JCM 12374]